MQEGFHAHSGWHFTRVEEGAVYITAHADARPDAPVVAGTAFSADTWASIAAAVSARGETAETFASARAFHMGPTTLHAGGDA